METIRLGIVGTGWVADTHAAYFMKEAGVQIAACCDVVKDKAEAFAAKHGIPAVYRDYHELFSREKLDAVAVATSDTAHHPVSIAALEHKLHVLCEKPLAVNAREASDMLRAARKSGKVHMVNFSYRAIPALYKAKKLIEDGLLGKILHVEASYLQCWLAHDCWGDWREMTPFLWRMSKKHGGGVLADIGCHIFDFVSFAVGDIAAVQCSMKSFPKGVPRNTWKGYKLDADDSFIAAVEFDSGAMGVIHASRWASGHINSIRLRVFGDKGALTLDTDIARDKLQVCLDKYHTKNAMWNTVTAASKEISMYARFIAAVRAGKCETPTFEDGARIAACQEACLISAETGKTAKVRMPK